MVMFFAKEGKDSSLTPMKKNLCAPVTVHFEQGLGQKFRQPSGTGIDFSMFEEAELVKEGGMELYPLAVKAEASPVSQSESLDGNTDSGTTNSEITTFQKKKKMEKDSQITKAVFENDKGEYRVKVVKQILWVNRIRYELRKIYGNDPGNGCVICLSEPRDTTVLPCRHMCMCSGCAKVLRFQTNRCPIC